VTKNDHPDSVPQTLTDCNDVTGVIKKIVRHGKKPLVSPDLFKALVATDTKAITTALAKYSPGKKLFLKTLINHLGAVAANTAQNSMTSTTLATAVGPGLLEEPSVKKAKKGLNAQQMQALMTKEGQRNTAVQYLIDNRATILP